MKKLLLVALVHMFLTGYGNLDMSGTNFTFDEAVIKWPDGTTKAIRIKQQCEYEGEQVQAIGEDGNVYLLSMNNTVLARHSRQ